MTTHTPPKEETLEAIGYSLRDLNTALAGVPETTVKIDDDGDILVFRSGPRPAGYRGPAPEVRERTMRDTCPHTLSAPYVISADRVTTPEEALDWLAHLACKSWGRVYLHRLAIALGAILRRNTEARA